MPVLAQGSGPVLTGHPRTTHPGATFTVISHPHKCVFVHIPKCGWQSIETAFLKDLGLDWRTRSPLLLRSNDIAEVGPPRLAHLTATQYVKYHYISQALFDQYFTFGIVRNPWQRIISYYHYLGYLVSFKKFVCDILPNKLWQTHFWFVAPQSSYVNDEDSEIMVKRIRQLEELNTEFSEITAETEIQTPLTNVNLSRPDLAKPRLGHRLWLLCKTLSGENVADLRSVRTNSVFSTIMSRQDYFNHWHEYFDEETKSTIASLYRENLETFDFAFA
jgi:hypothetical protein